MSKPRQFEYEFKHKSYCEGNDVAYRKMYLWAENSSEAWKLLKEVVANVDDWRIA